VRRPAAIHEPLGHDLPIQTLIDEDLLRLDTIWAAAGTPHAVFSLTPRQLVQATGALVIPISTPQSKK
jgi:prolyl-tRNA editing enzyme YbaK/EbsC (Cys-tRNA(Pro) deacylase)